LIQISQKLRPN